MNSQDKNKKTPLHISVIHGFFDISKLLVENGADLNILDDKNNSVIHLCSKNGHNELLTYLLNKNSSNINKKNKSGQTPIDLAKNEDTKIIINEFIKSLNKEINSINNNINKSYCSKLKIKQINKNQIKSLIASMNHKNNLNEKKKNIFYDYIIKKKGCIKKDKKKIILNNNDINIKDKYINTHRRRKYNGSTDKNASSAKNIKNSSNCFDISLNIPISYYKNDYINNTVNNFNCKNNTNTSFKNMKKTFSKNNNFNKTKNNIHSHLKSNTNNINDSDKRIMTNNRENIIKKPKFFLPSSTKIERYLTKNNIQEMVNNNGNFRKNKTKINGDSPGKNYFSNRSIKNNNNKKINIKKKIKILLEKRKNSEINFSKRTISSQGLISMKHMYTNYNLNSSKSKNKSKYNNKISKTLMKKINLYRDNKKGSLNKTKEKNNTFTNNKFINISDRGNDTNKKLNKFYTDIKESHLVNDFDEEETIILDLQELKEKKKLKIKEYNNLDTKELNIEKKNTNNHNEKGKFINTKNKRNKQFRNNIINNCSNIFTRNNKYNRNYNNNINSININNSNINITNQITNNIITNTKDNNINNLTTTNTNTFNNKEEFLNIVDKMDNNTNTSEKIGPEDFICIGLLGQGSFGEVYLVNKKNTDKYYAMKVLDKQKIAQQNLYKYAMTERNVLSLINCPFIVKLNYAFQTNQKLFLLLDYASGGDLSVQLRFRKRFNEEIAKFYICEIALALGELHKHGIIFRDLKPDNIVIDKDGHILLTDFGLSKSGIYDRRDTDSFCGSVAYLAPEMLNRKGHGKAVDWYLLGVVFYEMLVGIPPYFSNSKEKIFKNIEKAELILPNNISKKAQELIKALLIKNPDKRLGSKYDIEEIKDHIYFKDIDWDKVYNKKFHPPQFIKGINNIQFLNIPDYSMDYNNNDNHEDLFNNEKSNYINENDNSKNDKIYEGWSFIRKNN